MHGIRTLAMHVQYQPVNVFLLLDSTKDKTMMPSPLIKQAFSSEVSPSQRRDAFLIKHWRGRANPQSRGEAARSMARCFQIGARCSLQFPNIQTLRACFEGKENYSAVTPPCNYYARTSLHAIKHSWLLQTLLAIKHNELGKHS